MKVKFSSKFTKKYNKVPAKIRKNFETKLELFLAGKFHPLLNNHKLTGKYLGKRSINITGDWRAIYSEHETDAWETAIVFDLLKTHSQLYG